MILIRRPSGILLELEIRLGLRVLFHMLNTHLCVNYFYLYSCF